MNASQIADALAQLQDANKEEAIRSQAAESLVDADLPVVSTLVEMLKHPDYDVRVLAVRTLVQRGELTTVPMLIEALGDEALPVVYEARVGLASLGAPIVPDLIQALNCKNRDVRRFVIALLVEIIGEEAIPILCQALGNTFGEAPPEAADALGEFGDVAAVPALLDALKAESVHVRFCAARALGNIGDPSPAPALIELLKDTNEALRANAAEALGKLKQASSVSALVSALQGDTETVRKYAAEALGRIGDTAAVPALMKALKDRPKSVHLNAVIALGDIGDITAVPVLIATLQGREKYKRGVTTVPLSGDAAIALGKIGDVAVLPLLIKTSKSKDNELRRCSIIARNALGDVSAIPAFVEELKYRTSLNCDIAFAELKRIGRPALPALQEGLKHPDAIVRKDCAYVLAEIGDDSVVSALIETLTDQDAFVRVAAAYGLGAIGYMSAVLPLALSALTDKHGERYSAVSALWNLGNSAILPRKILEDQRLSAQQKSETLDTLRQVGFQHEFFTLQYAFPDTRTLCKMILEEESGEVRWGVQEVLDWLNGDRRTIPTSDANTESHINILPPTAQNGVVETQQETSVTERSELGTSPDLRETLRQRLLSYWNRLRRR